MGLYRINSLNEIGVIRTSGTDYLIKYITGVNNLLRSWKAKIIDDRFCMKGEIGVIQNQSDIGIIL